MVIPFRRKTKRAEPANVFIALIHFDPKLYLYTLCAAWLGLGLHTPRFIGNRVTRCCCEKIGQCPPKITQNVAQSVAQNVAQSVAQSIAKSVVQNVVQSDSVKNLMQIF
jgi:hypothetical protein